MAGYGMAKSRQVKSSSFLWNRLLWLCVAQFAYLCKVHGIYEVILEVAARWRRAELVTKSLRATRRSIPSVSLHHPPQHLHSKGELGWRLMSRHGGGVAWHGTTIVCCMVWNAATAHGAWDGNGTIDANRSINRSYRIHSKKCMTSCLPLRSSHKRR